MTKDVYESVVTQMRLGQRYNDAIFPMPITLDVSDEVAATMNTNSRVALRDPFFNLIAIMTVKDKYQPNKILEAE